MKLSIEGSLLYQFYLNLRYANCVIRHARCHEPRGRVIQVTNNFNCNISGSLYTSTFLGLSPLGRVDQCWLGLFPEPDPFSWVLTWNTAPMQSMQSKKLNEQVYVWRYNVGQEVTNLKISKIRDQYCDNSPKYTFCSHQMIQWHVYAGLSHVINWFKLVWTQALVSPTQCPPPPPVIPIGKSSPKVLYFRGRPTFFETSYNFRFTITHLYRSASTQNLHF